MSTRQPNQMKNLTNTSYTIKGKPSAPKEKKSMSKSRSFRDFPSMDPSTTLPMSKPSKENSRNYVKNSQKTTNSIYDRLYQQKLGRQKDYVLRMQMEQQ